MPPPPSWKGKNQKIKSAVYQKQTCSFLMLIIVQYCSIPVQARYAIVAYINKSWLLIITNVINTQKKNLQNI